jgi:hypothetical protein
MAEINLLEALAPLAKHYTATSLLSFDTPYGLISRLGPDGIINLHVVDSPSQSRTPVNHVRNMANILQVVHNLMAIVTISGQTTELLRMA